MKKLQRFLSVLLTAVLVCGLCVLPVGAEEYAAEGSFSFLNYNVAGLPSLNGSSDKAARQKLLGQKVAADGYDIVAVQEDFGYDGDLVSGLAPAYRTFGQQNVVMGDGLNVFSKTPVYNVEREGWNMKGGMIWEGDIVSQKGFLYTVVKLAEGVYLDVYDLHADAYGGAESVKARHDNFTQLLRFIEAHSSDRAMIVTGDFNSSFHFSNGEGADLYDLFVSQLGMSDAWTTVENGGSFTDYSAFSGSYWGRWDSVEHILYRSGDAVELTPVSHEYLHYKDDAGNDLSDHAAAAATFTYRATSLSTPDGLKAAAKSAPSIIKIIQVVFADLRYAFSHFDELIATIRYANDVQYLYDHYSR